MGSTYSGPSNRSESFGPSYHSPEAPVGRMSGVGRPNSPLDRTGGAGSGSSAIRAGSGNSIGRYSGVVGASGVPTGAGAASVPNVQETTPPIAQVNPRANRSAQNVKTPGP